MKKQYMKPTMRVVGIRQTHYICGGSNFSVQKVSTNTTPEIKWKDDGFADSDDDY